MRIYYDFEDCIDPFEYELTKSQVIEFLAQQLVRESKSNETSNALRVAEYIINEYDLYQDECFDKYDIEEMKDYFYEDAVDCWEATKDYEEDERDWFGTKKNVIGL